MLKPKKSSGKFRRYGLAAVGVVATAGGIAGNLGSILDLFDKFFGNKNSQTQVQPVNVAGTWQAEVAYDWGLKRLEQFEFKMDGSTLSGTVTYLGVKRAIQEGKVSGDTLNFVLQTQETQGASDPKTVKHQYKGKANGEQIQFELLSSGGFSEHVPVEFTARKNP